MKPRPAYSNTAQDKFILHLSRDECDMLNEAFSEYIEYYKGKTLSTGFMISLSTLQQKLERLV